MYKCYDEMGFSTNTFSIFFSMVYLYCSTSLRRSQINMFLEIHVLLFSTAHRICIVNGESQIRTQKHLRNPHRTDRE